MNHHGNKNIIKQCIVEFFGTGLITFFGIGSLAASKFNYVDLNQFEISCICGLAVSISIYFSAAISEAHLNPAITIFFWLSSRFNKKHVLPYIISQIFGSICFTMLIYLLYHNSLILFEYHNNSFKETQKIFNVISIFCIYPNYQNSFIFDFLTETFSTALFTIILLQLNSKTNHCYFKNTSFVPILIGILVFMINIVVNPLTNISLNPARDLGPKIFLSLTGYDVLSLTNSNNLLYCLIPIIGPILGANVGGWTYKIFIEDYFFKKNK
ncbi:aquaporin family protein [Buchnera aphidicola (Hyadaphis tataricae)]|uniref:Aquaporin family protein n=1 Tax=Buchnera aphidicola (Hyadaphis tataricae) TaxID=1241859 RepID=A0A4D6YAY9_9GAMM|nr:MIP/aquaporin family protein [Buchnera aphidicola]QCI21605.1 aquaporin family protein [Buchnera aphidicola (Hyadaphis tataricae)]